jgi:long-chain acyl-CoA synthetase
MSGWGVRKVGSIGMPAPDTDVRLQSLDDPDRDAEPGQPGELCIKGPQVMLGYWKKPEETAIAIRNGWFHTGDIAVMDDDGYFRIVDRLKDMIIVSGFNVYPREVEAVLATHPAVAEVAVVGVSHPLTGETVKAVVVLRKGVPQPDDLRAFCEARLARFKCPSIIEFAPRLPRAVTGKVTKVKLKASGG